jgi:PhzF family phenazine biosynthesis protein
MTDRAGSDLTLFQVDAFTTTPFRGNPAAVCLSEAPPPEATMRAIAAEMNLSETAFVSPLRSAQTSGEDYSLRWFTPLVEVPLCGHATLATAKVLFEKGFVSGEIIRFATRSGLLSARREGKHIVLDFPQDPPVPAEIPEEVTDALGMSSPPEEVLFGRDMLMLLLRLPSPEEVKELSPDFPRLSKMRLPYGATGVIVTAPEKNGNNRSGQASFDFVSRYFGPWEGIDEDPVTGSAHTVLGPYWAKRLGKRRLLAFQASQRGGELHLRLPGENAPEEAKSRMSIAGEAVIVFSGTFHL